MSPPLARAAFDAWRARAAHDWVDDDPLLTATIARRPGLSAAARAFAAENAGPIDALARHNNRDENLPVLARFDGQGNRREAVSFHPDYHAIGARVWESGILARYATPGRELESMVLLYLLAQNGEGGHCCPLACSAGMIKILDGVAGVPAEWRERLLRTDYAARLHASQFLTEVQGGSDVGANALVARPLADGRAWSLSGEKWFCSVIDAGLFLVTARPEGAPSGTGGLRAFVVPREHEGRPNGFAIRRLKYKLGTRSMASAEVDFEGAWALPVGDFRRTVEIVLNTSRLYNAVCAAGFLQRSWREADAYARARTAFGSPILAFPTIARIVARLRVEAAAAQASSFFLADLADRIHTGEAPDAAPAWRMLVNLNKIWTALTCPAGVRDAIEVFGGNGAIEEFSVLPRLLRDSIVLEAWEGGHGVLCAQLLKDARRGLATPLFALLREVGDDEDRARFEALAARWERVVARPDADGVFRDVVEESRAPVQAALMKRAGAPAGWAEHLYITTQRGWDPVEDSELAARVAAING